MVKFDFFFLKMANGEIGFFFWLVIWCKHKLFPSAQVTVLYWTLFYWSPLGPLMRIEMLLRKIGRYDSPRPDSADLIIAIWSFRSCILLCRTTIERVGALLEPGAAFQREENYPKRKPKNLKMQILDIWPVYWCRKGCYVSKCHFPTHIRCGLYEYKVCLRVASFIYE